MLGKDLVFISIAINPDRSSQFTVKAPPSILPLLGLCQSQSTCHMVPAIRPLILSWNLFFSQGDMWQCLETILVVTVRWKMLLVFICRGQESC